MNYLVIDVGGSFIKYALMNEETEIIERGKTKTPLDTIDSFLDTIESIFFNYQDSIEGIAISLPGVIDSEKGYIVTGGAFLNYNDGQPLVEILEKRLKVKVSIENDAKCAALAEVWKGNLQNIKDAIVIVLGSGVGGAIIKDGQVHKGKHFSAGEFSVVATNGENFYDFNQIWGEVCGKNGIERITKKIMQNDHIEMNGELLFQMIEKGNQDAITILDEFIHKLSIQIFNLQNIYDPEMIAIGGGISVQPKLMEMIKNKLKQLYNSFPYPVVQAEVTNCKFYNDANLIGALYNYKLFKQALEPHKG